MNIKLKNSSYFINLIENDWYAMICFDKADSFDLINKKLIELKSNLDKAEKKYNISDAFLSAVMYFKNDELTKKAALRVEKNFQIVNKNSDALRKFESELAYLLIKGVLTKEITHKLGFDEQYIKGLLTRYKNEAENPYTEYYYNEKNGVLSKKNENGFYWPLPYIPVSVANEINKREHKQSRKIFTR